MNKVIPEKDQLTENIVSTKTRSSNNFWRGVALLFFCLLVGFGGGLLGSRVGGSSLGNSVSTEETHRIVTSESELIADVAEKVSPSVVSINVEASQSIGFGRIANTTSAGTGIILSEDGLIVTNKHVVDSTAKNISVVTSENTVYKDVEVIGRDPFNDIAFIKVKDPKNFKAAKLGESDKVRVGDKVVAIGNALGEFSNSVTLGIISAKGRPVEAGSGDSAEQLQNLLQTDAAINQGNSGGPLVNISGEVIGMNTAIAGGDAQGIGFAIPVNDIKPGIETVVNNGKFEKPYLGVRYIMLSESNAEVLETSEKEGAYVGGDEGEEAIMPGSPASKADIKQGDVITYVGGDKVNSSNTLSNLIGRKKVGETVDLTIKRDGKEIKVTVKLEAAPSN